jgi:hypothetical protein
MTPDRAGDEPCPAAAEAMVRGPGEDPYVAGPLAWAVCLFGWAVESDGGACGRKAAKKVERKKGRCDGMFIAMESDMGIGRGRRMVSGARFMLKDTRGSKSHSWRPAIPGTDSRAPDRL